MVNALCPDCDQEIPFDRSPTLGEILVCPYCDADLEVIGIDPMELDWAYAWSDDEFEDEEEERW